MFRHSLVQTPEKLRPFNKISYYQPLNNLWFHFIFLHNKNTKIYTFLSLFDCDPNVIIYFYLTNGRYTDRLSLTNATNESKTQKKKKELHFRKQ